MHNTHVITIPSLSAIVTVALQGSAQVTVVGREDELIASLKVSLASDILSSVTGISNVTLVTPAGNVIEYGPES